MKEKPLPYALALARRGIAVFPVHGAAQSDGRWICTCGNPDCANPAKHPFGSLAPHGLKDATTDPDRITRWFSTRAWLNVGASTTGFLALDVDPRNGGEESLAALEKQQGALPETWRTLTGGGGEHIWFRAPEGRTIRNNKGKLGAGLDVKTEGGYVITPPSWHISGRPYAWSVDHHPGDVALADPPAWLVAKLDEPATPAVIRKTRDDFLALFCWGVGEGGRNNAIARIAGYLLRRNVDAAITLEICVIWNDCRCDPPLGEEELCRTVESIARKELERRTRNHAA